MNYGLELIDFYGEDGTSISIKMGDPDDKSESNESEKSEKEESKEKDKISQFYNGIDTALADLYIILYPDFYNHNTSVYLEQKTPPPELS